MYSFLIVVKQRSAEGERELEEKLRVEHSMELYYGSR